jgi:hypothetical protein
MRTREEVLAARRERKAARAEEPRKWVIYQEGKVFGRAFSCAEHTVRRQIGVLFPEMEEGSFQLRHWGQVGAKERKEAKRGFLVRPEIAAKVGGVDG